MANIIKWNPSGKQSQQLKALQEVFIILKGFKPHNSSEVDIDIAHLSASKNVCIKKLVYLYIALASHGNDDIFLMAMNSISNDLSDPNPVIRCFTLSLVGEVPITQSNLSFLFQAILEGLKDASSNVRCCAINCIIQLNQKSYINKCDESCNEYLTTLKGKVVATVNCDPDPSVVIRALVCLAACKQDDVVCQILLSLLDKVMLLDSHLVLVLLHYASISLDVKQLRTEKKFQILNKIEPFRQLTTTYSVTIEACCLMIKLSAILENVQNDILNEIISSLFGLLMVTTKAANYYILCNLLSILECHLTSVKDKFVSNLSFFVLLDDDLPLSLVQKINILKFCVTSENANSIFNIVKPYFHKCICSDVVKAACLLLEVLYEFLPKPCKNVIFCSLFSENNVVVECCVLTYYCLLMSQKEVFSLDPSFTKALLTSYYHLKLEKSRSCFLKILSNVKVKFYGKDIKKILQKEIAVFSESTVCHQSVVLHFTLFAFLQRPQAFHTLVKQMFLKLFESTPQSFVHEQAKCYYKLLNEEALLKKLIMSSFEVFPLSEKMKNSKLKFNDLHTASILF